jgi:hypothetical protein
MAGHAGLVRLAMESASPKWSAWPCVTTITSHRSTVSGGLGLFGLPNQGSTRTVFPPGVRISKQAWPYQVIVVSGSSGKGHLQDGHATEGPR